MNRRLLTILSIAFVIAAFFTFLVYRLVSNRVAVKPIVTTGVVAAKTDIKLGTILSADNLQTAEITGAVPQGAILVKDESKAIGRGVISDLYAGEPIMEGRLAAEGSGGGLAATIPPGMRACAVKVDDVVGVSGFVTPGMRVDVLISGMPPGQNNTNSTEGTVARTLLQNIQVLSAGTDIQKDNEGKAKEVQVVNLLVTPEQAETLSLASNQVTIRLVLRNPLDTKIDPVAGTDTTSLFTGTNTVVTNKPKPVAVPKSAPPPPPFSIEVINGTKTTKEEFASPEGHQ
jgi:pilus assembly protein CpaB